MTEGVTAKVTYETETLRVPPGLRGEVERLARSGEPQAQAELNALLDRYAVVVDRDQAENLVTDIGARFLLNTLWLGSAYNAGWYAGLKGNGAIAASDTMGAHAAWPELTGYSQATRPVVTMATAAAGRSITNVAARALFNITAGTTIAGFFVTNSNTKGGATGTLYSVTNLATARTVANGDIERLTLTSAVP